MAFVDGASTLVIQFVGTASGRMRLRPGTELGIQIVGAASGAQGQRPNTELSSVFLFAGTLRRSPRVASATAITSNKVRVTFDGQMVNDSRLLDKANYEIAPIGAGVVVQVTNVQAQPGVVYPTWAELAVTEMTDGSTYRAEVDTGTSSPRDRYGFAVNASGNFADFDGKGTAPSIASIAAVGQNRVDVKFSEPMLDEADIRDPGRYVWDNGLITLAVLGVVGDTVQLVTSDQTPGALYTLTISNL